MRLAVNVPNLGPGARPFARRGRLTDSLLETLRTAWADTDDYGPGRIPLWIGGNGEAGLRRTVSYGDAWHPLRLSLVELRAGLDRLRALATGRDLPSFAPRIRLQLTSAPVSGPDRPAGVRTIDQVLADLAELRTHGAETVVFDPFDSDPEDLRRPEIYWRDLATVMAHVKEDE